jgi:hypothetical protein
LIRSVFIGNVNKSVNKVLLLTPSENLNNLIWVHLADLHLRFNFILNAILPILPRYSVKFNFLYDTIASLVDFGLSSWHFAKKLHSRELKLKFFKINRLPTNDFSDFLKVVLLLVTNID